MKNVKKRGLVTLLVVAMVLTLTACGSGGGGEDADVADAQSWMEVTGTEATVTEVPEGYEVLTVDELQQGLDDFMDSSGGQSYSEMKKLFGDKDGVYFKDLDAETGEGPQLAKNITWFAMEDDAVKSVSIIFYTPEDSADMEHMTAYMCVFNGLEPSN